MSYESYEIKQLGKTKKSCPLFEGLSCNHTCKSKTRKSPTNVRKSPTNVRKSSTKTRKSSNKTISCLKRQRALKDKLKTKTLRNSRDHKQSMFDMTDLIPQEYYLDDNYCDPWIEEQERAEDERKRIIRRQISKFLYELEEIGLTYWNICDDPTWQPTIHRVFETIM
jgi:hypothetical protein